MSVKFEIIALDNSFHEIESPLGVKITHRDKQYRIFENNRGDLVLTSQGRALILRPKGGNLITIESEE